MSGGQEDSQEPGVATFRRQGHEVTLRKFGIVLAFECDCLVRLRHTYMQYFNPRFRGVFSSKNATAHYIENL